MSSRGRQHRKHKIVSDTRLDAALDAMSQFGFEKQLVRTTVQELLDVYEGTQGWPFIEEASYKLLIETILAKQQSSAEDTRNKDSLENNARRGGFSETPAAISPTTGIAEVLSSGLLAQETVLQTTDGLDFSASQTNDQDSAPHCNLETAVNDSGAQADIGHGQGIRVGSKNELTPMDNVKGSNYSTFVNNVETPMIQSSEAVNHLPRCRRKPFHGWIGSDDDEELIHFPVPPLYKQIEKMIGQCEVPQSGSRRRRKSRWDEKPDGM